MTETIYLSDYQVEMLYKGHSIQVIGKHEDILITFGLNSKRNIRKEEE